MANQPSNHRDTLRLIMKRAWNYHRSAIRNGDLSASFAAALKEAWGFIKGWIAHRAAPPVVTRYIQFGDLVSSPTRRALRGARYAATEAASRGYVASAFGR
ncbi:MAG: hypothetical protein CGW95_01610 [Phenylobacterium zucineum]|nr:MAG: hypothetical protein CGW95_01610 [Phenylobacterium zucineum]